jgi:hypothetical protein
MNTSTSKNGWGLIAGNGRFPFLVLEGARSQGIDMAVIAIKEEADPELVKQALRVHWVSLGELSKTILGAQDAQLLNQEFQDYLARFGELQKLGRTILVKLASSAKKPA